MGLYHLNKIFEPNSIAVIGASETQGSIGRVLMTNLTQNGYTGRVIPINPGYSRVAGISAYPSLSEADQAADLAVIATPISTVPGIVR
ncbi:MAG: CoA-binding protein, partial [Thermodesulfobacteriota bacterium]